MFPLSMSSLTGGGGSLSHGKFQWVSGIPASPPTAHLNRLRAAEAGVTKLVSSTSMRSQEHEALLFQGWHAGDMAAWLLS